MIYFIFIFKILIINSIKYICRLLTYNEYIINIIKELAELNIIFAKIFQWSFINKRQKNKYITDEIFNFINNYTNNTPYNDLDINYKKILQIYVVSKQQNNIFLLNNIKPINSGTISIVLKGTLNNNPIVIKLLRNNIETDLEKGLSLLKKIGLLMSFIPYINVLMFDKIIEKNKKKFYEQKNFSNEIINIELFHNKFKKSKFCVCPNVYPIYTNKINGIILMDYIDGKKINELSEYEKNKFILPLVKFFKNSIFMKNILHCDLHTGNILFITEKIEENTIYKIGVLDFGMIIKLSISDCSFCYHFINCIFNFKFIEFIEYMFDNKNYKNIFNNINQNNNLELKNYIINQHFTHNLFKNNDIEVVINDIYIFLSLFKKFNCEFTDNIYNMILGILPIFSVVVGLGNNPENNKIIKDEFSRYSSFEESVKL